VDSTSSSISSVTLSPDGGIARQEMIDRLTFDRLWSGMTSSFMIPQLTGDSSSKVDLDPFSGHIPYRIAEKVDPIQLIFFMCSRHDFSAFP